MNLRIIFDTLALSDVSKFLENRFQVIGGDQARVAKIADKNFGLKIL